MSFGQGKIWYDGKFVDWADAKCHVLSHVLHYGSSVFEGVRCYEMPNGSGIFRLQEHMRRLYDSAKIYRMPIPFTQADFEKAVVETVKINGLKSCYIRPIAFRGYHSLGVNPKSCPVNCVIAAWSWGKYLGEEAMEAGVSVRVSSWHRAAPNTFPTMAKAGGNYLNSQLIKMEALANGYHEGIALDDIGRISEGSGENLFLVWKGILYTPPFASSALPGITRASVLRLAKDLGLEVVEQMIPREMLYVVDEVFFTGTAAELTPVRSVDKIKVGAGRRGPVTEKLQKAFFDLVEGKVPDRYGWLTPVK